MSDMPWDYPMPAAEETFGFISIDEHTHMGCVIETATDLGASLVMLDAAPVPDRFMLYSLGFDRAQLCRAVGRTDETIRAWFDGGTPPACAQPHGRPPSQRKRGSAAPSRRAERTSA
ncbi:hypothetical protein ACFQ12_26185, partial [Methylobacterium trifolii]